MFRSVDVAKALVNKAVAKAEEMHVQDYYCSTRKLHSLLCIAQYRMCEKYGQPLFEEPIVLLNDRVCVDGLDSLIEEVGDAVIKRAFSQNVCSELSQSERECLDWVLGTYGVMSEANLAKRSSALLKRQCSCSECDSVAKGSG